MRNLTGFVLALGGAALMGFGWMLGMEGDWEGVVANMVLSFVGGMGIGSGLWMVMRRG
jgi:hypothetical protein